MVSHIFSVLTKAQQRLYFLWQLRKFNLPKELLTTFYSAIIQSVICTSITVWFGSDTKRGRTRPQRTIRAAERVIAADLPTIEDLYQSRVRKRAAEIALHPRHPGHKLLNLLPSDRWYRALFAKTSRHKVSFFPQAVWWTLRNSPRPFTEQGLSILFCIYLMYISIFVPFPILLFLIYCHCTELPCTVFIFILKS